MYVLLNIIGICMVVSGIFLLIFTERTRELYRKTFPVEKLKKLSFIPLVFGIILISGAFSGESFLWLPFILGLAGITKGVYFFVRSRDQAKTIMEWWFFKASPETIRLFGLISFVFGMALFR